MSTSTAPGYALFARFAFPPNELGYCGPADTGTLLGDHEAAEHTAHAQAFDGAWPYLTAIADAVDDHPLARGGGAHATGSAARCWTRSTRPVCRAGCEPRLPVRLRACFGELPDGQALAHHSFHVFVVYPWVRFLDRDPVTPLRVLQDCRIRWGTVEAVENDHAMILAAADVRRRSAAPR